MHPAQFDRLVRRSSACATRRSALGALVGGLFALLVRPTPAGALCEGLLCSCTGAECCASCEDLDPPRPCIVHDET